MKPPRTLVTQRLYFGLDAVRLREASGRVLARVVGLPPERAKVSATDLRRDFGLDTQCGQSLVEEMVAEGLLRRRESGSDHFRLTSRFAELASARVVEPLQRARARALVSRACDAARTINADWSRNPLVVEALAPFGAYLTRTPHLDALPLADRGRRAARLARARASACKSKLEGARDIRAAFQELSSFVQVRMVTTLRELARALRRRVPVATTPRRKARFDAVARARRGRRIASMFSLRADVRTITVC